jgi:hypothetical protein
MTTSDPLPGRVEPLRFLDDLLVRHPSLEQGVSEVARRTGRVVAVRATETRTVVADPAGAITADWPRDVAAVGTPRGVTVALGAPATPDDPLLLERLAVLVVVLMDREALTVPARSEPEQVAVLIDPKANAALRSQAMLGLGLRPATPVRAFTAAGPGPALAAFVATLTGAGSRVLVTARARTTVLLRVGDADDLDRLDVPRGLQISASRVHPASAALQACGEADGAFRFTQPSPRDRGPYPLEEGVLVHTDHVNGYDVLAEALSPEQISRIGDVQALDQVLALGGADMLPTLDVVATGSIRRAARSLRVHHNSVLHRVAQAERLLGFGLNDAYGRNRLFLALTLRRIRQTHGMV